MFICLNDNQWEMVSTLVAHSNLCITFLSGICEDQRHGQWTLSRESRPGDTSDNQAQFGQIFENFYLISSDLICVSMCWCYQGMEDHYNHYHNVPLIPSPLSGP